MNLSNIPFISGTNCRIVLLAGYLAICMACLPPSAPAVEVAQDGGTYASWPGTWTAIPGLDDPVDLGVSDARIDFVGNTGSGYPCGYIAYDSNFVYFRMRVDEGSIPNNTTYHDSLFVIIDRVGYGTANAPDYGIVWDAKGVTSSHGIELLIPLTTGTTWGGTRLQDLDGSSGQKINPDINREPGYLTDQGYIRTVDSQSTANFGTTTFVDFAVRWNYLSRNSTLAQGQTWRIQFGSIADKNDHNVISADVAGGTNPITAGLDWSDQIFPDTTPFDLATWLYNHPPTAIGFSLTMDQATQLAAFYNSPSGALELGDIRWSLLNETPSDKDSRSYWENIDTAYDNCGYQYKVDDGDFVQNLLTGLVRPGYIMDNSALIELSTVDANLLEDLYDAQSATPLELAGYSWSYFGGSIGGKKYGESWEDPSGNIYFYFNSGLEGTPLGGGGDVPEPSTLLLLLPFIGFGLNKMRAKKH